MTTPGVRLTITRTVWACVTAMVPVLPMPSILAAQENGTAREYSILMVGNSLTYFNDMPRMLRQLVQQYVGPARVSTVAGPNMGLEDHWRAGLVFDSLRNSRWDVVTVQQGPSATEGRPSLLRYSRMLSDSIRAAGAVPALYMVWPSQAREFDFPGVAQSYRMAAREVGGLLVPVGEAWSLVREADTSIPLYGPDRFHPSPAASYLAAVMMMHRITGFDPTQLDPAREPAATLIAGGMLTEAQARTLHRVALRANAKAEQSE